MPPLDSPAAYLPGGGGGARRRRAGAGRAARGAGARALAGGVDAELRLERVVQPGDEAVSVGADPRRRHRVVARRPVALDRLRLALRARVVAVAPTRVRLARARVTARAGRLRRAHRVPRVPRAAPVAVVVAALRRHRDVVELVGVVGDARARLLRLGAHAPARVLDDERQRLGAGVRLRQVDAVRPRHAGVRARRRDRFARRVRVLVGAAALRRVRHVRRGVERDGRRARLGREGKGRDEQRGHCARPHRTCGDRSRPARARDGAVRCEPPRCEQR